MKVIVLGDIHGNLPALEVALREARAEGYDLLCHTGDLVGFAPFPDESVALVREARIEGVRGDLDESVAAEADDCGCHAADAAGREFQRRAYAWTVQNISRPARMFLGNLPFELRLEISGRRTALLHATPIDARLRLWEDRDEGLFRDMGDASDADIILFGHTHRPFHRIVDGRHFINAGSVGFPGDGDRRTGYIVVRTNGNVEVDYRRFPYDTERLLKTAAQRRFPHEAARVFKG